MKLTPQQEMIRQLAHEFAEQEIAPAAAEIDETDVFPERIRLKMAEVGFLGIKVPTAYGGQGADCVSFVIMLEELCRVSAVAGLIATMANSLCGTPLLIAGTEEQKQHYLRPACEGSKLICFALTEPNAGSDAGSMQSTAVQEDGHWILNGRKTFITGSSVADYAVVFARTDPAARGARGISAFLLDLKQAGVTLGKPERKMGIHGCPTADIIMNQVRLSTDQLLGEQDRGFSLAMKALEVGRIGIAAQALGIAQGAFDEAVAYAKLRCQFGQPLAGLQSIQFQLAEMQTKLTASRLMVYEAAQLADAHQKVNVQSAMAKYYAAETAKQIVDTALQIHGGYGYVRDYPIERMYRDIRVFPIFEGTTEIQKVIIANSLLKDRA